MSEISRYYAGCGVLQTPNIFFTWRFPMTSPADVKALRNIYIQNPPEGISPDEIRQMSVDDLLDMDYFLHEDDDLFNDAFFDEDLFVF